MVSCSLGQPSPANTTVTLKSSTLPATKLFSISRLPPFPWSSTHPVPFRALRGFFPRVSRGSKAGDSGPSSRGGPSEWPLESCRGICPAPCFYRSPRAGRHRNKIERPMKKGLPPRQVSLQSALPAASGSLPYWLSAGFSSLDSACASPEVATAERAGSRERVSPKGAPSFCPVPTNFPKHRSVSHAYDQPARP